MATDVQQRALHCHKEFGPWDVPLDAAAWLPRWYVACTSPTEIADTLAAVVRHLALAFPDARLYDTPGLTGGACIEAYLPWGNGEKPYEYPALPPDLQELVHNETPQHRQAAYALPGAQSRVLSCYDRRLAYVASLRHLPTARGGVDQDRRGEYDAARAGWYRCDVQVPATWGHVGLVAAKADDGASWRWPDRPGERFTGWYTRRDLGLLREYAWPVTIHERILLDASDARGGDPLRPYAERMVPLLRRVDQLAGLRRGQAIRAAIRAVALHAIGWFHRRSYARGELYASWRALPADRPSSSRITQQPDGQVLLERPAPADRWQARWQRPEWSATIYAAARARVALQAMELPREQLAAIDGDALYLLGDPLWPPSAQIGDFRCDGHWEREAARTAPADLADYRAIKAKREAW
jgi:hypothetical protein